MGARTLPIPIAVILRGPDDRVSAALRQHLDNTRIINHEVRRARARGWEEVAAAGIHWRFRLFERGDVADEVREARDELGETYPVLEEARVRCAAPELLEPLTPDLETRSPPGWIAYGEVDGGSQAALLLHDPAAGVVRSVPIPDGWTTVRLPSVGPDGRSLAAIVTGPRGSGLAVGNDETGLEVIYEDPGRLLWCPSWSPAGDRVNLTVTDGPSSTAVVSVGRDGSSTQMAPDLEDFFCAHELPDGRWLAGSATDDIQTSGGLAVLDADGTVRRKVGLPQGCVHLLGDVTADGRSAVVSLRCPDAWTSGLYLVNLDSGEPRRVLAGNVATPSFDPSGRWVVFGFVPFGAPTSDVSVWLVRDDGVGLRQVAGPGSSFPAWLAPAPATS